MKSTVIMLLLFIFGSAAAALYYSSDVQELSDLIEHRATVSMPVE